MFTCEFEYHIAPHLTRTLSLADQHLRSVGVETARWESDQVQRSIFRARRR